MAGPRNWFSSTASPAADKAGGTVSAVILSRALIDAQLLLMIAAERAIPIDPAIVRAVLAAEDAFQKGFITPELSSNFWQAYEALSRALKPISIDSIRATHGLDRHTPGLIRALKTRAGSPFTRKSVSHYKLLALITLLSLIALQIFWSVGNNLVTDIREQTERITTLEHQILTTLPPTGDQKTAATAELQSLRDQVASVKAWRDAEIVELKSWNSLWSQLFPFGDARISGQGFYDLSKDAQTHIHFVSAQYMLHAISAYLLPVLYGLLGASFYVLRQLPRDIEALTFSLNSHIEYSLRIAQGPLAGIMAGYFFVTAPVDLHSYTSSQNGSAVGGLSAVAADIVDFSPLAIAFLAGYSVELIFYVIERIISAITMGPAAGEMAAPAVRAKEPGVAAPAATARSGGGEKAETPPPT